MVWSFRLKKIKLKYRFQLKFKLHSIGIRRNNLNLYKYLRKQVFSAGDLEVYYVQIWHWKFLINENIEHLEGYLIKFEC